MRGPTNLIYQISPYTGRQIEMFSVIKALNTESIKLINIVGPKGIGKTRFIKEVG